MEIIYFSPHTQILAKRANQGGYYTFTFVHLLIRSQGINTGSLTVLGFELVQAQHPIPNDTGTLSQPNAPSKCQTLLAYSQIFEVFREIK